MAVTVPGAAARVPLEIAESLVSAPESLRGVLPRQADAADLLARYAAYRERLRFHVAASGQRWGEESGNRCEAYSIAPGMVMAVVDVGCSDGFGSPLLGQDIVEFHFRLSGSIVLAGSWGEVSVRDPSCLLWYQPNGCNDAAERMGDRDRHRETWVSLYCDRAWLSEVSGDAVALLLGELASDGRGAAVPRFRLSPQIGAMAPILENIVRTRCHNATDWLFASAKANELLYVTLRNAVARSATAGAPGRLTARARHQLAQARDILTDEFVAGPGVAELARRIGVDASKLCAGFRAEFGETTSAYVRRRRLEFALQLLKGTDLQVREVALRAGYQHHSTFTAAFTRHFGVVPKQVRRASRLN